jgi:hypothetical protein
MQRSLRLLALAVLCLAGCQPVPATSLALEILTVDHTHAFSALEYGQPGEVLSAPPGCRFVLVDLALHNNSTEEILYSPLYATLRDGDGYEYPDLIKSPWPGLGAGTLLPGEHVRGWLAFQVPERADGLVLIYDDDQGQRLRLELEPKKPLRSSRG